MTDGKPDVGVFCPACNNDVALTLAQLGGNCANADCHVPYEFRLFSSYQDASDAYDQTSSWKTKYLFESRSRPGTWVVASFNGRIKPYRPRSISSLLGREMLETMQAGLADHVGAPITLIEIEHRENGDAEFKRIEPLPYAEPAEIPPHMRRFTKFCSTLRRASARGKSGDDLCSRYDVDMARDYADKPPYMPMSYHCWCNLIDYMVPVIVHGQLLGVLFSGQRRLEDSSADEKLRESVIAAAARLKLDPGRMLDLAFGEDVKRVGSDDINADLSTLQGAARRIEATAEANYWVERQVRDGHFLDEVRAYLSDQGASGASSREDLWRGSQLVVSRLREYVHCFPSVALLCESPRGSQNYVVIAASGNVTDGFSAVIPASWLDPVMADRLGPLVANAERRAELRDLLSERLVPYKVAFAIVVRMRLRTGTHLALVFAAPPHPCELPASMGECQHQTRLGLQFFAQLQVCLTRELDEMASIQHLLAEDRRRTSFLTRAAHSLSLPIQSIIADSANLADELESNHPAHEIAQHNFHEVQGLRLVIENLLHGAEEETDAPQPEYRSEPIFGSLGAACQMFAGEAAEKGCDIRVTFVARDDPVTMPPSLLTDTAFVIRSTLHGHLLRDLGLQAPRDAQWNRLQADLEWNGKKRTIPYLSLGEECYGLALSKGEQAAAKVRVSVRLADGTLGQTTAWTAAGRYFPPLEMVRDELELAFMNLVHNAVKYSYRTVPSGGKRYIEVRCELVSPHLYDVQVSDYGVGIEQREIDEGLIWRPRYRGRLSRDRNRTGSGLGLSHAKRAIEKIHGGLVSARSLRQRGGAYLTVFSVQLPVTQHNRLGRERDDHGTEAGR